MDFVATLREADFDLEPPASEADIERLKGVFLQEFGIPAPQSYVSILRESDGIVADGLYLYATHDYEGDGYEVFGLAESNERLIRGEHTIDTELRFIGEADDELLAYDRSRRVWLCVPRTTWDSQPSERERADFDDFLSFLATEFLGL